MISYAATVSVEDVAFDLSVVDDSSIAYTFYLSYHSNSSTAGTSASMVPYTGVRSLVCCYYSSDNLFQIQYFNLVGGTYSVLVGSNRLYYGGLSISASGVVVDSISSMSSCPVWFFGHINLYVRDFVDTYKSAIYKYLSTGESDYFDVRDGVLADGSGSNIDLGFLSDVQYFVDSAAYQFSPQNTSEFVRWGLESTTGVDLSDSRYQVEFALEDQSSYYVNRASDYVSQYGWNPIGNVGSWMLEARDYVRGLVFPSGSNARAILQGRSINTSFHGKFLSMGYVAASSRQKRFSAVASYLNSLSDSDVDEFAFRNFLQGYSENPSNGMLGHMAQNISQLGRLYSMSYNIYARIFDNRTGNYGDWLKIDRHNVPYWDGDSEDALNGRVTSTTGYRIDNSNISNNSWSSVVVSDANGEKPQPQNLVTGFGDNSSGNVYPIYNNYTYVYNYGNTYNNVNNNDLNNFFYLDKDGKRQDGSSTLGESLGLLGLLAVLWSWYLTLFGGLLPVWAVACIPVFSLIFVAVIVWRFGRSLL